MELWVLGTIEVGGRRQEGVLSCYVGVMKEILGDEERKHQGAATDEQVGPATGATPKHSELMEDVKVSPLVIIQCVECINLIGDHKGMETVGLQNSKAAFQIGVSPEASLVQGLSKLL